MNKFEYFSTTSSEKAVELVGREGRFLAGGTDLLGEMKDFLSTPDRLVNIKALEGLETIAETGSAWTVGAGVVLADLAGHGGLRKSFPGLVDAVEKVGSPQIRNMGTLGGNLAQHSRCWYYRHRDITCLKNRGSTCYARESENKYHSLFSGNPCISPVVSNLAVILTALGARANVRRSEGVLSLSMKELYQDAWYNPYAHHSLKNSDLILNVEIPKLRTASAYLQVSEKSDFDWALVSCAAAARMKGKTITEGRVALGAIANVPHQAEAANRFLEGRELNESTVAEAADLIMQGAVPQTRNGYKIQLAHTLIRRTLLALL